LQKSYIGMKRLAAYCLFTLMILSPLCAQNIGEWKLYPSYMNATKCVALDGVIYTLTNGNLFSYDTEDESVILFQYKEQLNDVRIAQIGVSKEAKRIIIVYENCNIDLLDNNGDILNISALKEKSISGKTINALTIVGNNAYICTGFGIVCVDMKEGVIRDSYNLNMSITGFLMKDNQPYLATTNNVVYTIASGENWHLTSNWQITTIVKKQEIINQGSEYVLEKGIYWHAEGLNGLIGYSEKEGKKEQVVGPIQPNSPIRDLFYRMNYVGNRLLIAGGTASYSGQSNPITLMIYENDKWKSFNDDFNTLFPNVWHRDATHFVQDPRDDTHFFAGSFRTALYEFKDGQCIHHWNCNNSPISMISTYGPNYCSSMGLKYDDDSNLWLLNSETDTIIRILKADGTWEKLYYEEIANIPTPDDYLFTTSGVNFVVSRRLDKKGFFGFTTNGTLGNTQDDQHILRTEVINQDNTSYDLSEFYCMTEDQDGRIWCGTIGGLFVINNPKEFFDDSFRFEQIKIARNDGSGLADYLLNGVSITCIAIDGANRKWVGTQGNGVYLISADGQEMIHHFLMSNSPLLSNNIQCLAIDPTNGLVMIGTDIGLCSYMSDAIPPEVELEGDNVIAYPNPVTADYTGPITIKGLTMDCEVKICSSTGQLVWNGTSNGGLITWNGRNRAGKRVSSGVYHIIANNQEGNKAVVCRIIVIR